MRIKLSNSALRYETFVGPKFTYERNIRLHHLHNPNGESELLAVLQHDTGVDSIQVYVFDGPVLVGVAFAAMYNNKFKLCTVGFFVAPEYRKLGVMSELGTRLKKSLDAYSPKNATTIQCASWVEAFVRKTFTGYDIRPMS